MYQTFCLNKDDNFYGLKINVFNIAAGQTSRGTHSLPHSHTHSYVCVTGVNKSTQRTASERVASSGGLLPRRRIPTSQSGRERSANQCPIPHTGTAPLTARVDSDSSARRFARRRCQAKAPWVPSAITYSDYIYKYLILMQSFDNVQAVGVRLWTGGIPCPSVC